MTDRPGGLHVVFGAGQVGPFLAERLVAAGRRVRVVKRTAATLPPGIDLRLGDAGDAAFCRDAAAGAAVVYHCMNPEYSAAEWERLVPRYLDNLVAAAGAAGARLVVLDNLYALGRPDGRPITEATPPNPCSRKGEIRARAAEALAAAHRRGDVRAVTGRASDFYGPRGTGTHFGEQFWRPALAGKPAAFLPRADTPHTYHFIPDVARGLAVLGEAPDDALGRAWLLPCAPAEPTTALVDRMARTLGRAIRLRGMPRWALGAAGLVVPMLRELGEMLHQWDAPFVVDDRAFRSAFGAEPTDPDAGAAATVAWARQAFAA